MLQSEGLVTMVPHVGAAVASLSRESVVDVFSVLEGLQVVAGRLAATEASAEDAGRAVSDGRRDGSGRSRTASTSAWADLNTRFHAQDWRDPGLTLLRQSNEQALDRWDRIRRFFYNGVLSHRVAQAQREHHELMAALAAHDAAARRQHDAAPLPRTRSTLTCSIWTRSKRSLSGAGGVTGGRRAECALSNP